MFGLYQYQNGLVFTGVVSNTKKGLKKWAYKNYCNSVNIEVGLEYYWKNIGDRCYQIKKIEKV